VTAASLLLALDLAGTFAFALNGAFTAVRAVKLDLVGVLALGIITALGGGIIRDVLLGALPPATFRNGTYLVVAAAGAVIAFFLSRPLERFVPLLVWLDAAGLSLFCVTGSSKAVELGMTAGPAVILGAVTAVGGGTIRDVLIGRVPSVLTSGLYAVPALAGAALTVIAVEGGFYGLPVALVAAGICFVIRILGVRYDLNAPTPPLRGRNGA
jgi:uncharacterized membrane protein YeiH